MKKSFVVAGTLFLMMAWSGVAQETKTGREKEKAVVSNAPARAVKAMVVPKGKTYVRLDPKKKKVIARYTAGQTMSKVMDCFKIPCPPSFPKEDVCWDCEDRPAEKPKTDAVLQR